MNRPSRPSIPSRRFKPKSERVDVGYYIYRVMKEMGWTVEELKQCPIPTFFLIIKWIRKEDEAANNGNY